MRRFFFIAIIFSATILLVASVIRADEISDLQKQIDDFKNTYNAIDSANKNNKATLDQLNKQLDSIKGQVDFLEGEIEKKKKEVVEGEKILDYQKELLYARANQYYKNNNNGPTSLINLLIADNFSQSLQNFFYQKKLIDEDKIAIIKIVTYIKDLEDKKSSLESEQDRLTTLKSDVDRQSQFMAGEVEKANKALSEIQNKIADLTAQQQALIAARSGNFSVSVGSAALADDYNASLNGWQANAPGGSLSTFSFGAYAGNGANYRRNGMSQYGAWARARAGQDYNKILQEYYGATPEHRDMPETINTDKGTIPFEKQYLYGIAEMPSSWTDNDSAALKAQAIAARTFAYHYIQRGQTICTDDHCQVYLESKVSDGAAGAWRAAVDATSGMVLPDNVSAQYVSTPGGYVDTKGWDTVCGNQGCLVNDAYDVASPWFYKAWYTNYKYGQGFTTCGGRSNPWLSQDDVVDIINAWIVYNKGSNEDRDRILPPDGCGGGNPFSKDEMRQKAGGDAVSSVNSVSVSQSTGGYTNSVVFQTDKGEKNIIGFDVNCGHADGRCNDFWSIFNLRAPGNISIKSRLYDVRMK